MSRGGGINRKQSIDSVKNGRQQNWREGSYNSKLVSEGSRTLKWAMQQYTPIQVRDTFYVIANKNCFLDCGIIVTMWQIWDWLFKSCEVNGRILLHEGLIDVKDLEECVVKGNCKKLGIKLPAWSILQCLLASAKADSSGLVICTFLFRLIVLMMHVKQTSRLFSWFF